METLDRSILRDQDDPVAQCVRGPTNLDANAVAENGSVTGLGAEQPMQEMALALTLKASEAQNFASVHRQLPR